MAEPLFLYRTQAETILEFLRSTVTASPALGLVQTKLQTGIANLANPVRLFLNTQEAAALEAALHQVLIPTQQDQEPWATILRRVAVLRGELPQRHWRSR